MNDRDEQIPYRATMGSLPAIQHTSTTDEQEFSTLLVVEKLLVEGMAQLSHFNAFDVAESEMKIKQQIKAHQLAFDMLSPLLETIQSTIQQVNSKYKR